MSQHPVRRCALCNTDWPNIPLYNLCPLCQRNTHASTAEERPDYPACFKICERQERIREFDRQQDGLAAAAADAEIAELEAVFALPAYDHPDHPYSKVVLTPVKPADLPSVQDIRYWGQKPDA